jgi:hypothetical protein
LFGQTAILTALKRKVQEGERLSEERRLKEKSSSNKKNGAAHYKENAIHRSLSTIRCFSKNYCKTFQKTNCKTANRRQRKVDSFVLI